VAYVYQQTNVRIYVNGELSGNKSGFPASSSLSVTRNSNFFGTLRRESMPSVYLDEIKIYNKALSQAQVQIDVNTVGLAKSGIC
jgi:hypothetical protein